MFSEADFPNLDVTLVTDQELSELRSDNCSDFWRNFHQAYPDASALIALSDIGFHNRGREAILYLEARSGCLAGGGELILVRREGKHWAIVGRKQLWVS